ncbi:unnamed protein product [Calicophoron daubneyi]|uniref:Uncharacterized protein n=1 Tax=Calicophoron daubneyi TaxID=300641 RepID=A0AAV2U1Q5_CALDB
MNLNTVVGDHLLSSTDGNGKLCLLLSHDTAVYEPILCDLIGQLLKSPVAALGAVVVPPSASGSSSGDCSASMEHVVPANRCLLITTQKSSRMYAQFLTQFLKTHSSGHSELITVSVAEWAQGVLAGMSNADGFLSPFTPEFGNALLRHIQTEIDKFLSTTSSGLGTKETVAIENLTALLDMGLTPRELERLLTRLIRPAPPKSATGRIPRRLVLVGCHVGNNYTDPFASDLEPAWVHCLEFLKARSSLILEVRSLATGYTASVDGELSITEPQPISARKDTASVTRLFHYRCEAKRVMCYPPGTSNLVT